MENIAGLLVNSICKPIKANITNFFSIVKHEQLKLPGNMKVFSSLMLIKNLA